MEEQRIKQAIQTKLETVEMSPYLKNRTMDYIARKSRKDSHRYRQIKKISLTAMTFATVMLVVLVQNKETSVVEPQYLSGNVPMAISSEGGSERTRSMMSETSFSQFKTTLNDLEIDYIEGASFISDGTTIHSLLIDDAQNYYLELSTDVENLDSCSLIESILAEMNESLGSYQVVKLDSQSLFLYSGDNKALLDQLAMESANLVCSK